jgi:hypothetical protein
MDNVPVESTFNLNRASLYKWMLLSLVLLSLLITLYVQLPLLTDSYKIGDDLRHLYWMMGFQDPELFSDDPQLYSDRFYTLNLGETRLLIEQQSPGYSVLYYLASFLMDPILVSKILPFALMPIYVTYLFKIGQRLKNNTAGLLLGLLGIAFGLGFPGAIRTGYQRGFAFPLTAMFLYYAITESHIGVTASLVLQGLFYPPTLAVSALAYVFSWVRFEDGGPRLEITIRKVAVLAIAILVVAVILSPVLLNYVSIVRWTAGIPTEEPSNDGHIGLFDNPAYGASGRDPVFVPNRIFGIPLYLIVGFAGLIPNYGVAANLAPLLLLCGLIAMAIGYRSLRLGRHTWSLFNAGLLLFAAAWIIGVIMAAFVINMPNKYVKVTIPLVTMIFIAHNLEGFITGLLEPRRKRWLLSTLFFAAGAVILLAAHYFSPHTMISKVSVDSEIATSSLESLACLRVGILSVGIFSILLGIGTLALIGFKPSTLQHLQAYARPVGVLMFVAAATWFYFPTLKPAFIVISQEERSIIEYVATLPKDVLITGAPEVLDNLPLLAKRQVAFSPERLSEDRQLIVESFDAYYAESSQQVLGFCHKYSIDYWVVNLDQFEASFLDEQRFFYDPFNDEIVERIQGRHDFVFPQIPAEAKLFEAENLFVVKCDAATFAELGQ